MHFLNGLFFTVSIVIVTWALIAWVNMCIEHIEHRHLQLFAAVCPVLVFAFVAGSTIF